MAESWPCGSQIAVKKKKQQLTLSYIMLKIGQGTLKILRWKHRKFFKIPLSLFNIMRIQMVCRMATLKKRALFTKFATWFQHLCFREKIINKINYKVATKNASLETAFKNEPIKICGRQHLILRDCLQISLLILSELFNFYSPEFARKHTTFLLISGE